MTLSLAVFDVRHKRSAYTEAFSYIASGIPLGDKVFDAVNILIGNLLGWVVGSNRSKLIQCGVPVDAVTPSERMSTVNWTDSSPWNAKSDGYAVTTLPSHSGLEDVIYHVVGDHSVCRNPSLLASRGFDLREGGVPIDPMQVRPCSSGVDGLNRSLALPKNGGYFVYAESIHSHAHDSLSGAIRNLGHRVVFSAKSTLSAREICEVFLVRTPSKVRRIAAGRVVAGMKRYIIGIFGVDTREDKGEPVCSPVLSVMPEYTIPSLMPMPRPLPAFIRPQDVNLLPESFHSLSPRCFFHHIAEYSNKQEVVNNG